MKGQGTCATLEGQLLASMNKCSATSNKGITSSMKLLLAMPLLLAAMPLLLVALSATRHEKVRPKLCLTVQRPATTGIGSVHRPVGWRPREAGKLAKEPLRCRWSRLFVFALTNGRGYMAVWHGARHFGEKSWSLLCDRMAWCTL